MYNVFLYTLRYVSLLIHISHTNLHTSACYYVFEHNVYISRYNFDFSGSYNYSVNKKKIAAYK